ncbi:unnamed protein product [Dovyalis caffra]|uniref:Uncharacterized protein n=1 Tax=Dovyalis caffra TaxID=77055 RepID=A0AAV1SP69_9ROSI|nr:unnamed protein product [Dovyalis caffra]
MDGSMSPSPPILQVVPSGSINVIENDILDLPPLMHLPPLMVRCNKSNFKATFKDCQDFDGTKPWYLGYINCVILDPTAIDTTDQMKTTAREVISLNPLGILASQAVNRIAIR